MALVAEGSVTLKMAKRSEARKVAEHRVYVWTHTPYSIGQPRIEWSNCPKRWDESIERSLPHLIAGPLFDPSEGTDIGTGLPPLQEEPTFMVDRDLAGKPLFDVTGSLRDTFIVSARAKAIFEQLDPEAFVFTSGQTKLASGEPGPELWLADVTRRLDALDFDRSDAIRVSQTHPNFRFSLSAFAEKNVFRRDVIGNAHFFRLRNSPGGVYCDDRARKAINAVPKLRGVTCFPVGLFDACQGDIDSFPRST